MLEVKGRLLCHSDCRALYRRIGLNDFLFITICVDMLLVRLLFLNYEVSSFLLLVPDTILATIWNIKRL